LNEQTDAPAPPATGTRRKAWIFGAAFVDFFANGMLNQWYFPGRDLTPLDFLFGFFGVLLIFWWYRLDAAQRGFKRPRWLGPAIVLLPIVGMPVYLFKSRGFARGLLGTGIFLVVVLATGVATMLGLNATYYLFQV
jgi:hypothetical protein